MEKDEIKKEETKEEKTEERKFQNEGTRQFGDAVHEETFDSLGG